MTDSRSDVCTRETGMDELSALYEDYERLAVLWHRMWCDHDVFPDEACPLNRPSVRDARALLRKEAS